MGIPASNISIKTIRDAISDDTSRLQQQGQSPEYFSDSPLGDIPLNPFGFNSPDINQLNAYWGKKVWEWPAAKSIGAWRNYNPDWYCLVVTKVEILSVGEYASLKITARPHPSRPWPGSFATQIACWAEYKFLTYSYASLGYVEKTYTTNVYLNDWIVTSSSEVTTTIRTGLITNDMGGYTFVNELTVWVRTGAETYAGDRRLWFPYATMYFNKVAITSNDYRNYEINSRGATVVPTYPGMDYVEASYNDNPDTLFAQDTVSGITVDLVSLRNWHNIDIPCVSGATSAILKIGQAGWPASKMMTFYASFDPKTIVNGIRVIQRARWYDGTTTPLEEIGFDASDWKTQCSDPAYRVTHGSPVEWALYFKYKLDGYWMDVEGWLTGTSVWQWFY